jgi:DNA-binding MarR family transcriptional regulator
MRTTPPTLNGQAIGEASAVLRRLLETEFAAATGTSFHEWTVLNGVATGGPPVEEQSLVFFLANGLQVDPPTIVAVIDNLEAAALLRRSSATALELTSDGQELHARLRQLATGLTAELQAGIPAEDLATAGRVLADLTAKATARLQRGGTSAG